MADAHLLITENIDIWTTAIKKRLATGRGNSKRIELTGIKNLRELILELAVRGKLVPQDPNDEPASVLLERVSAEKEKLITEKQIKKTKPLPEISIDEMPFELPNNWLFTRLDNIGTSFIGLTYSPKDISDKGIPVLRSSNIQKGKIDLIDLVRVNKHVKERLLVNNGDLLICARNGSKALVGKTAMIRDLQEPMVFGAFMAIFKCSINSYVEVFLNSPVFRRMLEGVATTTINQITQSNLKSTIIFLPPLAEQQRIVAKADELMLLCDQLEQQTEDSITAHQTLVETLLAILSNSETPAAFNQNWARIAEHFDTLFTTEHSIDQLKQTILQLAVMGKLVPQNPNDEPASVLLKKIAAEKEQLIKDKKIKKQKPLPAITEDEKPFELPGEWVWCDLQHLITTMDAGWSPACPPDPSPSNEKWGILKTTAVQSMEYREYENKVLAESKEPKPQYEVKIGDILITRAGPKNRVGVSCLVQSTRPKLMISDKIIRFHLVEVGICERYISLCLNAGVTAEYLEKAKSGMAESQMNISQNKLKVAPIPLCAVNEQHRIVKKVDELITLCDQLKDQLSDAKTTQLHLADAIVKQAVS